MVGKRAEAQMRVVVNEACDDDDDGVGGRADALGVCPPSHWRRLGSSGEHSRPNYQDPQKGEGGGTSKEDDNFFPCNVNSSLRDMFASSLPRRPAALILLCDIVRTEIANRTNRFTVSHGSHPGRDNLCSCHRESQRLLSRETRKVQE